MSRCIIALGALAAVATANDNGLAAKPPLGWRSWNLYGARVNQPLITGIMDGVVKKGANGVSLADMGYTDVGLDDNWQACGSKEAAPGMHYHRADGSPIVNLALFPDFNKMTAHAHSLNLTSGWYGNNCICSDHAKGDATEAQIKMDVAALIKYDFDSWKLDGCGSETDMVMVNKYIMQSGKDIMVENCHWGSKYPFKPDRTKPAAEGCPWNFYRTSGDVRASYASIMHNLGTVTPLAAQNLSYPGCWAYPDMLQVGCQHGPGGKNDPGLTDAETRTHFAAWAIVSSPLTLSHDVNNDTVTAKIWDVITNEEALAVSQAYSGHSGSPFGQSDKMVELTDAYIESNTGVEGKFGEVVGRVQTPSHMSYYKPMEPNGAAKTAILLLNSDSATQTLSFNFADVPEVTCKTCKVRDVWAKKDLGTFTGKFSVPVDTHDAAFLTITPA